MSKSLSNVMSRLRSLAGLHEAAQHSDRALLERFLKQHDEAAFTAIVERHGPMVLKVCRRVLNHQHDAEDACQATFLVLVRRASAIRKLNSLGCWLHGVAFRVSMKLRAQLARTRRPLTDKPTPAVEADKFTCNELAAVLDEELQRLPEKYRTPLILCYLQAKTRDEAAKELGWSESTLKGRLEWGRKLLRERLVRRGVALSAALLMAALVESASAAVPASLVVTTVKSATLIAAGKSLVAGSVAPTVAALVHDFMRGVLVQKLQIAAAVCLLVVIVAGAGWFTHNALTGTQPPTEPIAAIPVVPQEPKAAPPVIAKDLEPVSDIIPPLPEATPIKALSPLERGAQIVNSEQNCGACHTPRMSMGALDMSRHLQGADFEVRGAKGDRKHEIEAPDITMSGRAGKWNNDKLTTFLTKGGKSDVAAHRLAVEDATAVSAYLRSLPGKKRDSRRDD